MNQPFGQPPHRKQPFGQQPYGQQPSLSTYAQAAVAGFSQDKLAFLRKVYALFTVSIVCSAAGALFALNVGGEVMVGDVAVPPLVLLFAKHWWLGLVLMLGSVFGASMVQRVPGVNVAALLGMASIMGVVIAPSVFAAQLAAATGSTLSASPVRDAFLLATAEFVGLSAYAFITRKDFSYMRGFLSMGLFVVIAASILNIFLGSAVFGLAVASVVVLLFGGYILYDTSRLIRAGEEDSAVGFAIQLYLDFLNVFLALLRIFSSRR